MTVRAVRAAAGAVAIALVASACTGSELPVQSTPRPSRSSAPAGVGLPVEAARRDPLCRSSPVPPAAAAKPPGALPAAIATVAKQVERIRNLTYLHPVPAQPVTRDEMARLMREKANGQEPKAVVARTAKAWSTIGAIPKRTDLYKAVVDFDASQVLGFYDPEARRLVFIGSSSPSAFERFTLSHELTHALDDQRFNLRYLDKLQSCRDDEQGAYVSLAEGDAVVTSVLWARETLSSAELRQVEKEATSGPSPPKTVPPFVVQLMDFPYEAGPAFIEALLQQGGSQAVNDAFRHPPVSTEQVLHPDRYPTDRPVAVDVPNVGPSLGPRWKEIEIEQVGEAWLQLLLGLHLSSAEAENDTDHWGGGQYRAWADGKQTAVVMDVKWDDRLAAGRFVAGMERWLGGRATAAVLRPAPGFVRVLFASNVQTLAALRRILG